MKKLVIIGLLLGVLVAVTRQAEAQGPVEMIAYDACYPYYWSADIWDWTITCDVLLMAADGSKHATLGDGVDPAWSQDGSRIAFAGYSQPGIFVVNLADWSFTKVSSFGDSPAWSPDGMKLAFGAGGLFVMDADGSHVAQLTNNVQFAEQPTWSPDGTTIAFDCEVESGNRDICSINADGTGFVRLTSDPAWDSGPAFSPDGFTIAFATTRYIYLEIAVMNPDGTGVSQVSAGTGGYQPAWSPDGTRIAFVQPASAEGFACNADGSYCPGPTDSIYVMNVDGTDSQQIASGDRPAWALSARPVAWFVWQGCNGLACAFDGSGSWGGDGSLTYSWNFGDGTTDFGPTVTHSYTAPGTYTVTLTAGDGTGVVGTQSRSLDVIVNIPPTAAFASVCSGRHCTFDGSGSSDPEGPIASYFWNFGDGETSSSSAPVSHTYQADGTFTVSLTVTDGAGGTGTEQHVVNIVNAPPVASFTRVCAALVCSFDASGSSDLDGTIASYAWSFGDSTTGSGVTASHMYAAGGSYAVTLLVTDNGGATGTQTDNVTVVPPGMHVGDLDRASTSTQNTWTATVTITIHEGSHGLLANVAVSGTWNDGGAGSCTTNASGQCAVSRSGIPKNIHSANFSVTNVARAPFLYKPADNHDPDGDSNGTSISVTRP